MTQSDPVAPLGEDPHKPADDKEEVYFDGSPLLRGELGKEILYSSVGLLLIFFGYLAWSRDLSRWLSVVLYLAGLAMPFVLMLFTKTVRYRITNYRIDYERGIFTRNIDTLELWHVEDIRFHQTLLDRMMGVGTITVVSRDETTPQLRMHGIPNPRPLFESLKQRVIAVKRQRGVIKVDPG